MAVIWSASAHLISGHLRKDPANMCNQATGNKHRPQFAAASPRPQSALMINWSLLKVFSQQVYFTVRDMSSELLVSRPHCDSRAVAVGLPEMEPPVRVPQPSSGSATAGYRSAKYTPGEWFSNYHSILQQAGTDRLQARSVQRESRSLHQDTEAATLHTQAEGTRLLGERLQDLHHWRSELQRHIEQLQADNQSLVAVKMRLEKALDATENPYVISTDNLTCRTRRLGPDLVRDSVEEQLLKVTMLLNTLS